MLRMSLNSSIKWTVYGQSFATNIFRYYISFIDCFLCLAKNSFEIFFMAYCTPEILCFANMTYALEPAPSFSPKVYWDFTFFKSIFYAPSIASCHLFTWDYVWKKILRSDLRFETNTRQFFISKWLSTVTALASSN